MFIRFTYKMRVEIIYGSEAYGHLKTRKPPPCRRASCDTAAAAASTQGPRKSLRGFEPPAPSIHRDDEEVDSGTGERLGTARRTRPDPSPRERRTISRAVAHDKQRPFFGKGKRRRVGAGGWQTGNGRVCFNGSIPGVGFFKLTSRNISWSTEVILDREPIGLITGEETDDLFVTGEQLGNLTGGLKQALPGLHRTASLS
ncbi:hypothetical protein BHE74_00015093 [Ensete ventricosum]|nr:hypothetical protein BHE74_00015093 [Ensete ventricosum]